jgi:formate dehydrogenase subunit gamma
MEGAFEAMSQGTVDVNWAKEHHNLWYAEEVQGSAKGRAKQAMHPAE